MHYINLHVCLTKRLVVGLNSIFSSFADPEFGKIWGLGVNPSGSRAVWCELGGQTFSQNGGGWNGEVEQFYLSINQSINFIAGSLAHKNKRRQTDTQANTHTQTKPSILHVFF